MASQSVRHDRGCVSSVNGEGLRSAGIDLETLHDLPHHVDQVGPGRSVVPGVLLVILQDQ